MALGRYAAGDAYSLAFMSAYKDALHISASETGQRLQLAAELVKNGRGVIVIENVLALRPSSERILCEVIASGSAAPQVQVRNAQSLLRESSLGSYVQQFKQQWLVVEDYGMGTVEVWHES